MTLKTPKGTATTQARVIVGFGTLSSGANSKFFLKVRRAPPSFFLVELPPPPLPLGLFLAELGIFCHFVPGTSRYRSRFQASFSYSDSANWPGDEA